MIALPTTWMFQNITVRESTHLVIPEWAPVRHTGADRHPVFINFPGSRPPPGRRGGCPIIYFWIPAYLKPKTLMRLAKNELRDVRSASRIIPGTQCRGEKPKTVFHYSPFTFHPSRSQAHSAVGKHLKLFFLPSAFPKRSKKLRIGQYFDSVHLPASLFHANTQKMFQFIFLTQSTQ